MDARIELDNVSLKFRIYRDPSPALKEQVLKLFHRRQSPTGFREFYALKDLSLRISHGERVGIIGLNGAGKSTLLRSIVGIYPPSQGAIRIRGRVVPLIEVGTGFDLEMSGRANIYLNGALLARSREEMRSLEDEIVEFSGLREFMDLPVKYYSSGMFGRLAFSIATMIEPEILIVDEIFSAGDAQFVDKAVDRMQHLFNNSQIVLMVSHSKDLILQLCDRVLVMEHGRIVNDGKAAEMVDYYYSEIVHKERLEQGANNPERTNVAV